LPAQTIHHLPEWVVVGNQAHDDGIAEEDALHTAASDREVNDTDD
jgi:hypothetical protein